MASLRQKQISALKQMLNLNQPQSKLNASEPIWKVLVYDRVGQDIISPLISVKELRELGVTLHVQLHSDRDPIPEVPAIYFCVPNDENLGRISQDFQRGIYDIYHLNFISPITRQKLEDIASAAIQSSCVANIHKVYDQYINFISLEDDMFILKHQGSDDLSYYSINRSDIKDTEIDFIMDSIVDSLFSVFVTLGTVPIIRSPKGNAAEMVAKKLDKKLRENLFDARNNLFHSDTQTGAKSKTKPYELDSKDKFWTTHKGSPFPTVAEAIQEELEQYRSSEEEVKKLKSSMGIDNDTDMAMSMVTDNTAKITSAVNSLPQLIEKKRLIDMHTTVATEVLNYIKSRKLDTFFELEEKNYDSFTKMSAAPSQYEGGGTKTVNMFSKLVSQGSSFVMEGVKNLVVKRHNLPVTKIVDHLMEFKNSHEMEEYHYLDPKQLKLTDIPRNRSPFQDAIIFIVGGGNYIEYQNLVDYAKQKTSTGNTKRIVYGCSTLNNAKQFLKQLSMLGQEI
ncbi:vesicle protein sorting-associated [Holotrichia oblita]|uniref:Vesicle protein sorting-associated n=1 Tax=Holotrichia oblita TaxID=644536 RepID=A0ACB9T9A6_HOLOL|nr:vesicle protein sorting-associated [Holotrichia oblita]